MMGSAAQRRCWQLGLMEGFRLRVEGTLTIRRRAKMPRYGTVCALVLDRRVMHFQEI